MSITEEIKGLINKLSEENFKSFIRHYIALYYKADQVNITDGPYDIGKDIEIIVNHKVVKRVIQIARGQENIAKKKVTDDFVKFEKLVSTYGYSNNIEFYTNVNLTNDFKEDLKLKAELDHGIIVNFFDANHLATATEKYEPLKKMLISYFPVLNNNDKIKSIDEKTKKIFDFLANSSHTENIRSEITNSYIYQTIYEKTEISVDLLYSDLKKIFNITYDQDFFEKNVLNKLMLKKLIIKNKETKLLALSDEIKQKISHINSDAELQENALENKIHDYLKKNDINVPAHKIFELIIECYSENYNIDIEEINAQSVNHQKKIKKIYEDLQKLIASTGIEQDTANMHTKAILDICMQNDYLNKISLSNTFINLYQSEKLEEYINQQTLRILLDTQVLLRLICLMYREIEVISDYESFDAVSELKNSLKKFKTSLRLQTTYDYVTEVAGQLQECLRLGRFLNLEYIDSLGPSHNAFFNYYSALKKYKTESTKNIYIFINDLLGELVPNYTDPLFIPKTSAIIKTILENIDIQVMRHPTYEVFPQLKKEVETDISYSFNRRKTFKAAEHDIKTAIFLSEDNEISNSKSILSPYYLITFDFNFYNFRKIIKQKFPSRKMWYIYQPYKFTDKLSVQNFQLNPRALTYNIIALAEYHHDSKSATSFLDILSIIVDKDELSDWGLGVKLKNLYNNTINIPTIEKKHIKEPIENPLTEVLSIIQDYYSDNDSKYNTKDLSALLIDKTLEDQIISKLTTAIQALKNNKLDNKSIFNQFDELINQTKKT